MHRDLSHRLSVTMVAVPSIGFDQYDHTDTDTDYPIWIHIKPKLIQPIILIGFISNRYRYRIVKPIPIPIIDIGYTDLADYRSNPSLFAVV